MKSFILVLIVFASSGYWPSYAAEIRTFSKLQELYESGTVPALTDFSTTQVTAGEAIYANRPENLVPMWNLIYVEGPSVYQNAYFSDFVTNVWNLEQFVRKFQENQSKFTPLEVDNVERALKTHYRGAAQNVHFLRVADANGEPYLIQKFQCLNVMGCKVPYVGTSFHHFGFNEVISYAYFEMSRP